MVTHAAINSKSNNLTRLSFIIFGILFSSTLIIGCILANTRVGAVETTTSATASVNVSAACTMTSSPTSGGNTYTDTITPGTSAEYGPTTLTATCNDPTGFSIYAIGYSGNSYTASNHTKLISTLSSSYDISTNTPSSASSNSYWSMKLASVAGDYPAMIANSYDNYNVVPDNFTQVAYRTAATDIGTSATGSSVNASYKVGIAADQVADTYTGKVKYTLVHPNTFIAGTYTINFLANGGTGTMPSQTTTSSGAPLYNFEDQTLNALSTGSITPPTGYQFAGWCTVQDNTASGANPTNSNAIPQTTCEGSSGSTPAASYPDQGTVIASTVSAVNSGSTTTPGTLNLYAYYKLANYTITLDQNGATTASSPTSVDATYNSSALSSSITNPSKSYSVSGFTMGTYADDAEVTFPSSGPCTSASNCAYTNTFNGWYNTDGQSGSNPGTEIITTAGALTPSNGWTDANSRWTSTSNQTVYARWTAGTAITLPTITKTGYTCGWSENSSASTYTYASGYTGLTLTTNMTLYGICEIKTNLSLKVSFDSNVQSVAVRYGSTSGTLMGTVTTSGNSVSDLTYNADYYLVPTYKSGYEFSSWSKDSGTVGTLSSTTAANPYYRIGDGSNGVTLASKIKTNLSLSVSFDSNVSSVAVREGSTSGTLKGTVSTSGNSVSGLTYNTNYYLIPTYKSGYQFSSWTKNSSTVGTLSSTTAANPYYKIGDGTNGVTLASKITTFALAFASASKTQQSGYYKMQDMSSTICSKVKAGQTAQLIDTRDSNVYYVGKLNDNKCWMLDNLRLDLTSSTVRNALTTSNTNVNSASLTSLKSGNRSAGNQYANGAFAAYTSNNDTYSAARAYAGSKNTVASVKYGSGSGKIGVFYNYCAASAGSYCYGNGNNDGGTSSGNASYDLCPTGWRLPTGGSSGEFQNLYTKYSSNLSNYRTALSLALSGYSYSAQVFDVGKEAYWWTSTRNDNQHVYDVWLQASSINTTTDISNRSDGETMRCISK